MAHYRISIQKKLWILPFLYRLRVSTARVKPYRTPPSATYNLQQHRNVVGWFYFPLLCIFFFVTICLFFQLKKFVILRVKYLIPNYCIYRNVVPQNLNSLLRQVVAKWTFAVWFHACRRIQVYTVRVISCDI